MVILLVSLVDCQKKKKKKINMNTKMLKMTKKFLRNPPTVCYMNYTEGEENKEFTRECPTAFICKSPPFMWRQKTSIEACGYSIHETKMCFPNPRFNCGENEGSDKCPPTHECDEESNECIPRTTCSADIYSNIKSAFKSIREKFRKPGNYTNGDMKSRWSGFVKQKGESGGSGSPKGGKGPLWSYSSDESKSIEEKESSEENENSGEQAKNGETENSGEQENSGVDENAQID